MELEGFKGGLLHFLLQTKIQLGLIILDLLDQECTTCNIHSSSLMYFACGVNEWMESKLVFNNSFQFMSIVG